jgi:hypothetical protein
MINPPSRQEALQEALRKHLPRGGTKKWQKRSKDMKFIHRG